MSARHAGREILLEMTLMGHGQEVRAVDAADGLEVCFITPADAPREEVRRLAEAKLDYVRRRQHSADAAAPNRRPRGGVIV